MQRKEDETVTAILREAVAGRSQAQTALYHLYSHQVHRFIRKSGRWCEQDIEDLSQTIWLKVFRALPSFNGDADFKTWLFAIAKNEVTNLIRQQGRSREILHSDMVTTDDEGGESSFDAPGPSSLEPDRAYEINTLADEVERVMDEMEPSYRRAVQLRDFDGLSYEEVAEAMGASLGATKTRIRRGRLMFKELISGQMEVTDEALIDRAKQGDERSWRALVRRYQTRLEGFFVNERVLKADVYDCVQKVWLRVVKDIADFDTSRGSFDGWLFGMARHVRGDYRRSKPVQERLRSLPVEQVDEEIEVDSPEDDLLDGIDRERVREKLEEIISRLHPNHQELIRRFYFDGEQLTDIAKEKGLSSGAVKHKLWDARRRFREVAREVAA